MEADVLQVVRCRNCKFWAQLKLSRSQGKCALLTDSWLKPAGLSIARLSGSCITPADWFCPLGERPEQPVVEPMPALEEPVPATA